MGPSHKMGGGELKRTIKKIIVRSTHVYLNLSSRSAMQLFDGPLKKEER